MNNWMCSVLNGGTLKMLRNKSHPFSSIPKRGEGVRLQRKGWTSSTIFILFLHSFLFFLHIVLLSKYSTVNSVHLLSVPCYVNAIFDVNKSIDSWKIIYEFERAPDIVQHIIFGNLHILCALVARLSSRPNFISTKTINSIRNRSCVQRDSLRTLFCCSSWAWLWFWGFGWWTIKMLVLFAIRY